ncbi:DUF7535 family protein [Halegenticoccus tardaugens]|uniref:DUF7535 family protein n=1 Tax=Halegenticoccus tardaugens TaxID=2071624 RepID=UPI00100A3BBE|nr:hypothetical protein [Halegenticoccus tardaugens]
MSANGDQDPGVLGRAYRTVTPPYRSRPDSEMNAIGIAYALLLVILIVPLLPFMIIVWLLGKLFDAVSGRRGGEESSP